MRAVWLPDGIDAVIWRTSCVTQTAYCVCKGIIRRKYGDAAHGYPHSYLFQFLPDFRELPLHFLAGFLCGILYDRNAVVDGEAICIIGRRIGYFAVSFHSDKHFFLHVLRTAAHVKVVSYGGQNRRGSFSSSRCAIYQGMKETVFRIYSDRSSRTGILDNIHVIGNAGAGFLFRRGAVGYFVHQHCFPHLFVP